MKGYILEYVVRKWIFIYIVDICILILVSFMFPDTYEHTSFFSLNPPDE